MRSMLAGLVLVAGCNGGKDDDADPTAGDADTDSDTDSDSDTDADSDADTDTDPGCFTLADGRCLEETFHNPPVLQPDGDGVHHLKLAPTEIEIDGQRHCVRAYNGAYPGPTIDTPARSGNTERHVRVDLANALVDHAYTDLEDQECTCTDSLGADCLPEHVHDRCYDGPTDCVCRNSDGEECHMADFNVTNLHAHGSHVRPDYSRGDDCVPEVIDGIWHECRECGDDVCDGEVTDDLCYHGDNVLNAVHPGMGARYRWDIDEDGTHHAGMQWYHPHIHGTTAIQVGSGAAGAWIVRGEVDALPGLADARERVMIFSTPSIGGTDGFVPLDAGEACTDETLTFDSFYTLGHTFGTQINVLNDQRRPRMITAPGQVERWRILHAGFLDEVFLGLFRGTDGDCSDWSTAPEDTVRLTQIGRDGLLLPQAYDDDYLFLSPGYRIETVFGGDQLEHGDTWCLVAARFLQEPDPDGFADQPTSPPVPPSRGAILRRFDTDGDLVATLNVTDDATATTTTLPDLDAVAALAPSVDVGGRSIEDQCAEAAAETEARQFDQAAVLQVGFWTVDDPDPCDCEGYNVNCRNFEHTDRDRYPVDRDLPLGEVEHWRIGASVDGHPFHLHINPYVVCPNDNVFDPMPFPHWRDTYLVNVDRKIDLVTENRAFTGPYVFHCHKLTHEDEGMMQVIRVCDPATDPTCGDYAWDACDPDDLVCHQQLAATECALEAEGTLGAAACVQLLGGPLGVCGPNACGDDGDCDLADACEDHVCVPAACPLPCLPTQACEHGVCR